MLFIKYKKLAGIYFVGNLYPGSIRQTEKPAQSRGKGQGRSAAILPSVGHLLLITSSKIAAMPI